MQTCAIIVDLEVVLSNLIAKSAAIRPRTSLSLFKIKELGVRKWQCKGGMRAASELRSEHAILTTKDESEKGSKGKCLKMKCLS